MKTILLGLMILALPAAAGATDKAQLDRRIEALTEKFEVLQSKADKRIPAETLKKARGIILLDRTKAGFIFAFQGGGGLAMVRDESNHWSPVAFVKADEASLGLQVGGQQSFLVILLMNTNVTRQLMDSSFKFGGEAQGTAGNSSASEETKTEADERSVLVYDDRKGLFGGVSFKGGALAPDADANRIYYEKEYSVGTILFGKEVKPTDPMLTLQGKLKAAMKAEPPKP